MNDESNDDEGYDDSSVDRIARNIGTMAPPRADTELIENVAVDAAVAQLSPSSTDVKTESSVVTVNGLPSQIVSSAPQHGFIDDHKLISINELDDSGDDFLSSKSKTTTRGMRRSEIKRTTDQIGASRTEVSRHLRDAAFRRKKELVRSRDSLLAKEQHQRYVVAASVINIDNGATIKSTKDESKSTDQRHQFIFKALSMPQSTNTNGGLIGVPKVEKRPTTIPSSPMLGPRRRRPCKNSFPSYSVDGSKEEKMETNNPSSNSKFHGNKTLFRARPAPRTSGICRNAGQSGIPKVYKKLTTVPESPLLGSRRPVDNAAKKISVGQIGLLKVATKATTVPESPLLGSRRPKQATTNNNLRARRQTVANLSFAFNENIGDRNEFDFSRLQLKENVDAQNGVILTDEVLTPRVATIAYVPRSTDRAARRASFDAGRIEYERQRQDREQRVRQHRVRKLRKELQNLRPNI